MRPNIEVMCTDKFQYATSAMLALPYDHFLVSLLFLDVPITVIVPSLLLTSFLNVFIREYGSTPYVGMTRFFSFSPYIGIGAKSQNRPKIDKTRLCIAKYTIYIL